MLQKQGYYARAKQIWLLKKTQDEKPFPKAAKDINLKAQPTLSRWIPTKMLQEQGYYTGAVQIWLPKKAHDAQPSTNKAQSVMPKAPLTASKQRPAQ